MTKILLVNGEKHISMLQTIGLKQFCELYGFSMEVQDDS
jgi:hypothetical protein